VANATLTEFGEHIGPTSTSAILTEQATLIASGGIVTSLGEYDARMPASDDGRKSNLDLRSVGKSVHHRFFRRPSVPQAKKSRQTSIGWQPNMALKVRMCSASISMRATRTIGGIKNFGIRYPVACAADAAVARRYDVTDTPTIIFSNAMVLSTISVTSC
jgi:hypothetical protein